jgi:hypothetical protein
MGLADDGVQPSMVDVVEPRPRMQGRVRCGDAPLDQAREELAGVVTVAIEAPISLVDQLSLETFLTASGLVASA